MLTASLLTLPLTFRGGLHDTARRSTTSHEHRCRPRPLSSLIDCCIFCTFFFVTPVVRPLFWCWWNADDARDLGMDEWGDCQDFCSNRQTRERWRAESGRYIKKTVSNILTYIAWGKLSYLRLLMAGFGKKRMAGKLTSRQRSPGHWIL